MLNAFLYKNPRIPEKLKNNKKFLKIKLTLPLPENQSVNYLRWNHRPDWVCLFRFSKTTKLFMILSGLQLWPVTFTIFFKHFNGFNYLLFEPLDKHIPTELKNCRIFTKGVLQLKRGDGNVTYECAKCHLTHFKIVTFIMWILPPQKFMSLSLLCCNLFDSWLTSTKLLIFVIIPIPQYYVCTKDLQTEYKEVTHKCVTSAGSSAMDLVPSKTT